jgi:hypothetical protein
MMLDKSEQYPRSTTNESMPATIITHNLRMYSMDNVLPLVAAPMETDGDPVNDDELEKAWAVAKRAARRATTDFMVWTVTQ